MTTQYPYNPLNKVFYRFTHSKIWNIKEKQYLFGSSTLPADGNISIQKHPLTSLVNKKTALAHTHTFVGSYIWKIMDVLQHSCYKGEKHQANMVVFWLLGSQKPDR